MKKLFFLISSLIFIAVVSFAQSSIDDLSLLKANKKATFNSSSGRKYVVKWKDSKDKFDPAPGTPPKSSNKHAGAHVHNDNCPSVNPDGDEDSFAGNARCEAKLNPSSGDTSEISINDLSTKFINLFSSTTFDNVSPLDLRTSDEEKNYKLKDVRIYAIKKEADKDYHLIIGPPTVKDQSELIDVEISGLPDPNGPNPDSYTTLQNVRNAFTEELTGIENIPVTQWTKYLFFPKGIPITITGSIFFDVDHCKKLVGPAGVQPSTSMELHPVIEIVFTGKKTTP